MTNVPPNFEALLRGVSFRSHEAKSIVRDLEEDYELELEREPDNAHDENAIMVLDKTGATHLGYIAKETAAELAPWMDKGFEFTARVGARFGPDSVIVNIDPVADEPN